MTKRKLALALTLFLCLSALLSGALLILHTDHACQSAVCSVCLMLARNTETFLCLFTALAVFGLIGNSEKIILNSTVGNRLASDGTLVHRKVKLQN